MVFSWLAPNPRARRDAKFGRVQQFVINPAGIPEPADQVYGSVPPVAVRV